MINEIKAPRRHLPPIKLSQQDGERLGQLAEAAANTSRVAEFLAREIDRATIVPDSDPLTGIVGMESEVTFRDDTTGQEKNVTLVYPNAADIAAGRISVLTPIGAALIGLAAGQTIEFETPSGDVKSLTVIDVRRPA